jgi:hypothetical protein
MGPLATSVGYIVNNSADRLALLAQRQIVGFDHI